MARSIPRAVVTAMFFCYAFAPILAQDPAIATSGLRPLTYNGCYSSSKPLTDQGSYTYNSPGLCQKTCVKLNKPVMATTGGSNCFCGDQLPLASSKTSDSQCSIPCFGYGQMNCGGQGFWSVQLTGLDNAVSNIKPSAAATSSAVTSSATTSSSSDSSSTSTSKPTPSDPSSPSPTPKAAPAPDTTPSGSPSIIGPTSTIVVTAPGQSNTAPTVIASGSSGGPPKGAIAAGVIVGVAVVGAIAGGLFFFLRHRRRAREDELNQNTENPFRNHNLPSSAASMSDSRLEPSVMLQRRQSDGSIADNQDYSRRILQVTNPDNR